MARRIVILWTQISGYLAASVRSLAATADIEVEVFTRSASARLGNAGFDDSIAAGLDVTLLGGDDDDRWSVLPSLVAERKPDLVVVGGWGLPAYRDAAVAAAAVGSRVILAMDTAYQGPRHALVRRALIHGRYRQFWSSLDGAFVPGVRGARFAEALGFPSAVITRGLYAFDADLFGPIDRRDSVGATPIERRFLFVGQYDRVKGLDLFLEAYAAYVATTRDPWPLTCMGRGPLEAAVKSARPGGVTNRGFVAPSEQPRIFREHDVLVLPSRSEPWGVVLAEAAAIGLPILCTDHCGAAPDLVDHLSSGFVTRGASVDVFRDGLKWFHDRGDELDLMWGQGSERAMEYANHRWPDRVRSLLR
jgi:glycosyltransferase involved in cell wall biosynthesis